LSSIRTSRRVKREIMERYDENPEGWLASLGRDRRGFLDLLISQGNESWQVKEFQVNPYEAVGYGGSAITRRPLPCDRSLHQFGLRPLTEAWMKELAASVDDPETVADIMSKILKAKPVSTVEAMRSQAILQGPIVESARNLHPISEAQKELDQNLRHQLDRLITRKYRHTLTPYI